MRFALSKATRAIPSDTPRRDAELLMAQALGITRERMLLAGLDDRCSTASISLTGSSAGAAGYAGSWYPPHWSSVAPPSC